MISTRKSPVIVLPVSDELGAGTSSQVKAEQVEHLVPGIKQMDVRSASNPTGCQAVSPAMQSCVAEWLMTRQMQLVYATQNLRLMPPTVQKRSQNCNIYVEFVIVKFSPSYIFPNEKARWNK